MEAYSNRKEKIEPRQATRARLTADCMQMDEATIRYIKAIAARKGIDCQSLIRMWARERFEVEMRKMFV